MSYCVSKTTLPAVLLALLSGSTPLLAGQQSQTTRQIVAEAEQGDADAQYNLGWMYANGEDVAQDLAAARSWYLKAAERGHADAQYDLGDMYLNGQGGPQDLAAALWWYLKAAEQGVANAQYQLGDMYLNGWGGPQDLAAARNWYLKAAEQGVANAQYQLGVMYLNGWGGPQDLAAARNWYLKAAAQGNAEAQSELDRTYDEGTARAQFNSNGTGPNKRQLPKFGPSRGRYENACERMVGLLISFPVTTGDIDDGCVCANNAIESATLPQELMQNIVRTVAGQEYLYFAGMENLASSSSVLPREVSLAADEMYDNVKICLGAIPLIENTYGAGSRFTTPEKMVARGTDVRPISGPARPHFRGVGGLRRMGLETVMEEVGDIWHQRQAGQPDSIYRTLKDEYGMHSSDYIQTVSSIGTVTVLQCEYARANRNFISNSYYFWYKTVPTGFNDELTSSLPPQHPIFAIGVARQWCPDREPAK